MELLSIKTTAMLLAAARASRPDQESTSKTKRTSQSASGPEPDRSAERINTNLPCFVLGNGCIVRKVTIDNLSRRGLLLRGVAGMYLRVNTGDHLQVHTEIEGVQLRLEGGVVRSTHIADLQRGSDQLIALGELDWYQGWA